MGGDKLMIKVHGRSASLNLKRDSKSDFDSFSRTRFIVGEDGKLK